MIKLLLKLMLATMVVLTLTNAASMISTTGEIKVKSLLSPFHFRIKVLNSLEYTTILMEYAVQEIRDKIGN